jgi:hypothetical protein
MTPRGRHPATTATVPRPELPQARLVLGAAAAAVGLFVALHWIVVPGDHVSLDQKNGRTESVAALDSATHPVSRRNTPADVATGARRPAHGRVAAAKARKGQAAKTAPHTAGKPVGTSPGTTRPGVPGAGDPPATGSNSPASTETPPAGQSSPPPPPPSPPPPPIGVPQLPQLPDVPDVPQVPVPTVPDLPTPQAPTVSTPQVPSLP